MPYLGQFCLCYGMWQPSQLYFRSHIANWCADSAVKYFPGATCALDSAVAASRHSRSSAVPINSYVVVTPSLLLKALEVVCSVACAFTVSFKPPEQPAHFAARQASGGPCDLLLIENA